MRIAVTVATMALASNAWAAGFDCKKASSTVEKVICSDSELSTMDDEVNQAYKRALATAPDAGSVKTEQKAWLASRNRCHDSACIKLAYILRLTSLGAASVPTASGNSTGTYRLSDPARPAELHVQQTAGKIHFKLHAEYIIDAKTGNVNDGDVSGEVPLEGNVANYQGDDPDERCSLSFKFAPEAVSVSQEGTCGMGMNVIADGTYKLVDSSPPQNSAVVKQTEDSTERKSYVADASSGHRKATSYEQEKKDAIESYQRHVADIREKYVKNDVVAQVLNYSDSIDEGGGKNVTWYSEGGGCKYKKTLPEVGHGINRMDVVVISGYTVQIDIPTLNRNSIRFQQDRDSSGATTIYTEHEGKRLFSCSACLMERLQNGWAIVFEKCPGVQKAF